MTVIATVAVPLLTLLVGAAASYFVTTRQTDRDLRTRQRIDYLVTAYRVIEGATNRPNLSAEQQRALEQAVADVNLLGSEAQQRAIQVAQAEMARTNSGGFDEVLHLLRRDLRAHLGIEAGLDRVSYFRMGCDDPMRRPKTDR